jgi:DNA modification methylase
MNVKDQYVTDKVALYCGDSAEVLKSIPDESVGYMVYSPPFARLYTYSNSERDLGNCRNYKEFFEQFCYIGKELFRTLMGGRLMTVHCMDIPLMKERDGVIGLTDFPGDIIRMFQDIGFIYHSRCVVEKDPLIEATRTKALGLMHKQIQKDSAMCRQGLPDYIVTMRKPGENPEPIEHPDGFTEYIGENVPKGTPFTHHVWRNYANPVWKDINQSLTLNKEGAREDKDEAHVCPLQLQVIERCIELWSNPNDIVLSPFLGIGSECYVALKRGRRAIGIELKDSYFRNAILNCQSVETQREQITFDDIGGTECS